MPKLIDYPRTSYSGAWELSEIVDDTGGKSAIETAARKLNRKVSGSFKAIIGSAVKFGLLTSKRELLTTTTLFRRIKHAYDKQEELLFHREAFLTPALFTQLCRKFRARELPVQMLDVMLIREFGVEEINAQGVAKAFVDGCRMVGLLNEHNIIADIDALGARQPSRRELTSKQPSTNAFRNEEALTGSKMEITDNALFTDSQLLEISAGNGNKQPRQTVLSSSLTPDTDAIASLFGLGKENQIEVDIATERTSPAADTYKHEDSRTLVRPHYATETQTTTVNKTISLPQPDATTPNKTFIGTNPGYQIQISGPGINTTLSITEEEDIILAVALLEKIRRQLRA